MKNTIKDMKNYIILILIGIFSYWGLNNLDLLWNIIKTIYKVLEPFILGGIIAFVLNIPATKIENFLKSHIKNKKSSGLIRIISIISSLSIFLLVILFIAFLLIPELLLNNIPNLINNIQTFIIDLLDKYPEIQTEIKTMFNESGSASNIISNILNYIINGAADFIGSIISSFVTIFTSIIFSIYILGQKEYLIRGTKKVMYVTMNKEYANKLNKKSVNPSPKEEPINMLGGSPIRVAVPPIFDAKISKIK